MIVRSMAMRIMSFLYDSGSGGDGWWRMGLCRGEKLSCSGL